jgi:hypothetical protein
MTDEQKRIIGILKPYWDAFMDQISSLNEEGADLCFTGFLYSPRGESDMLLHIANIWPTGNDLVEIHRILATGIARIGARNQYERTSPRVGLQVSNPQEIADKLAMALIADPSTERDEYLKEILDEYVKARRPESGN